MLMKGFCTREKWISIQLGITQPLLTLFEWGGGEFSHATQKISEQCLCSHHNNTALIKQMFLFDTALRHDKCLKFQFNI